VNKHRCWVSYFANVNDKLASIALDLYLRGPGQDKRRQGPLFVDCGWVAV